MRRECDDRLRRLVGADERAIASGIATLLLAVDDTAAGDWRFLVITDRRMLSAHWGHPDRPHEDLAFDAVTAWADGVQYHRYFVLVAHRPVTRWQPGTRWHQLALGRSARAVTCTSTVLRFSRRDTAAATALRAALSGREAPHQQLVLPQAPRDQRTRGSRATAVRMERVGVVPGWRPWPRR